MGVGEAHNFQGPPEEEEVPGRTSQLRAAGILEAGNGDDPRKLAVQSLLSSVSV